MNTHTNDEKNEAHLKRKLEAQQEGMLIYPPDLEPTKATGPYFESAMWDSGIKPGVWMRYRSQIGNAGTGHGSELTITTFFGPGCLYADPVDGIATRDQAWPMLHSDTFTAPPQQVVTVEMGHRLALNVVPGNYMLNLLLWQRGSQWKQATLFDRLHIHFKIVA